MFALLYSQKRYFYYYVQQLLNVRMQNGFLLARSFHWKYCEKNHESVSERWLGQTKTQQGKGCFLQNTENWKSDV